MQTDPTLQKLPPQCIEAEESILTACLLGSAQDVTEMLSSSDFYRTAHQTIFSTIEELLENKTNVDTITVSGVLRDKGKLEETGGAAYLARLLDTVPGSISIKDHAELIKSAARKRKIIKACQQAISDCYDGNSENEILGRLDQETSDLIPNAGGFKKIRDLLVPQMEKWEALKSSPGISGIPCGLIDVDRKLSGFQGSNLIVIGARPSMGKSALGMRFCRGAAKHGFPAFFISIEMSCGQVVDREISCESHVDGERFRSGEIAPKQWDQIAEAVEKVSELPYWVDDSAAPDVKDVRAKIRNFIKENGKGLVVIDYLQYIKGLLSERKDIEIGTITRGLKSSAKEHDIPIVLLAQLNRSLESRNDKRPVISDLRGSGEIEQDADIIGFLYRDEVYNPGEENPNRGVAELIIRKFREGKIGTIYLTWIDYRTTFENISK